MELFLVLIIAILVLRPSDVQKLAKLLGQLIAWRRSWQNRSQQLLQLIEQHADSLKKQTHD